MMALAISKEEVFALDRKGGVWSCPLNGEKLERLFSFETILTRASLFVVDLTNKLIVITDDKVNCFKIGRKKLEPLGALALPISDRFAMSCDSVLLAGGSQNRMLFWDLIHDQRVEERAVCLNEDALSSSRLMSTFALSSSKDIWVYGDDRGGITLSELGLQKEEQTLNPRIQVIRKTDIGNRKKLIGARGSYGQVYVGEWGGKKVAYKKLIEEQESEKQRAAFINEVNIMSDLKHDNIARLYGVCLKPYAVVMQFENGGTLCKLLHENKDPLSWTYRYRLALDVSQGLNYLHTKMVLHRDLKSDNVLLDDRGRAKITDFGLAKIPSYFKTYETNSAGANLWQAPEVLKGRNSPGVKVKYGPASDVYSLGMVLYEIALRKLPFDGLFASEHVLKMGARPDVEALPLSLTPLKELMKRCWETEREKRPQMEQILKTLSDLEKEVSDLDRPLPLEIIKKDEIQVGKEINLGAHCRLSEGIWKKHPVTVREFFTQGLFDSSMQGKLLEEAKRLRALSHPNLFQLYAVTFESGLLVVEEGAAGVPLSQEVAKLNPEMRKQAARQIAEAVAYLHAQGLRHEGLYTDGVLITPQGVAKVSDLGFREIRSRLGSIGHTIGKQGRAAFSAPELAEDPPKPSEKSDIFALGMIFYELFVGMPPFGADKDPQISRKIDRGLRPTFPPTFNPKDKALIEACWNQDPAGRPTIVKVNQELKL